MCPPTPKPPKLRTNRVLKRFKIQLHFQTIFYAFVTNSVDFCNSLSYYITPNCKHYILERKELE